MAVQTTILCFLLTFIGHVTCQNRPPVFIRTMNGESIYESVKVGTSVYTLYAEDETEVKYYTDTEVFSVHPDTGVVTLNKRLDYEDGTIKVTIKLWAVDTENLETVVDSTIGIIDANDNAPRFSSSTYLRNIPENFPVNGVVDDNLVVNDVDYMGGNIRVTCNAEAARHENSSPLEMANYEEACKTFAPVMNSTSNQKWRGKLITLKPLDFEKRGSYQIPLETSDGTNKRLQTFEILLTDVEDSPPRFKNVTEIISVKENSPLNTRVGWAIAEDGDRSDPRDVVYEATPCPESGSTRTDGRDIFSVNGITGGISTKSQIDRESDLFLGGLFLCVKAREVINTTTIGNDFSTTSVTTVRIDIEDLNDEIPTFNQIRFNTSIYEDIVNGSPVPGVALTVSDNDLSPGNAYNIRLKNYQDIFEIFPNNGTGRTIGIIKVIDSSQIDYESAVKKYELYIVAEEITDEYRLPQTATVTIHILDRNDNTPRFYRSSYTVSVEETDPGVDALIRNILAEDPDSGWMGTSGIRYSLLGSGYEHFNIVKSQRRGLEIRVAPCATPGRGNCIDYERRRRYDFTIVADDMEGDPRGNQGTASLIIHIIDVNDNRPKFTLNSYVASIYEGRTLTVNPLLVTANDVDTVGEVSFRLEPTDQSRYWRIDKYTGNITAIEAIYYTSTPAGRGWFDVAVIANDTVNTATADVRINVIAVNTYSPRFVNLPNITVIPENIGQDVSVFTVFATDDDPPTSDNGKVQYTIEFGARGKFAVDPDTGVIRTQRDATFDYDLEVQYILTVYARDGGNPQRTGTGTLTVNVIDLNNKNPYFTPKVQISSIQENAAINTLVTTIKAKDLDKSHVLIYNLVEPVTAINPDGVDVLRSMVDYTKLFRVRNTTGEVVVAGKLDRDLTSIITYTMTVTDVFDPNNPQFGEAGQLQIHILEYNDQSPVFQQAVYNLTVEEEQAIGTFIMALVAQDEDDAIDRYEIVERDQMYFLVTPDTGELIVRTRLDYEAVKRTEFTVVAIDTGSPPRTGTATVNVNFVNINDNSPQSKEGPYYVSVQEHSPPGTSLLNVSATDKDEGDYGEVRYSLPDSVTLFNIDNRTGSLRLSDTGEFDREVTPLITSTVIIYDSPLDETVRRSSSVQVYISLEDINDNAPVFSSTEYISAEIIESIDIGAQILQVFATDRDFGINAKLLYEKVAGSGDPEGLFGVDPVFGRITVSKSLRNQVGVYVFRVSAKDLYGGPGYLVGYTTVNITVIESLNSVPVWFIPPDDNVTIEVLESQYLGMLVFDVHANDSNSGNNGIVEYFLQVAGKEVSRTKEFSINQVTGVIRAEMVFDRETVDKYTLHLVAKDKGYKPLIAERFLTIQIIDVNDNAPEFPMENGVTKDINFVVPENMTVKSVIGVVTATDRDLPMYTKIYYHILVGDESKFAIDKETGEITLKESVDREKQEVYSMEIRATNGEAADSSMTQLLYHESDPSVVTVTITLQDINDVSPYFVNFNGPRSDLLEYYGFVATDAAFDQAIVMVTAIDDDYDDINIITYYFKSGNTNGTFGINRNGLITNRKLLDRLGGSVFTLEASVTDQKWISTAPVKIFVAAKEHEAKIIFNRNQDDIFAVTPQLIRKLESIDGIDYVGVTRVTNHMASSAISSKSDVYVAAATVLPDGRHRLLSSAELLGLINGDREKSGVPYDDLGVSAVGAAGDASPWFDRAPVLAVLIICLLLILLAAILLCLACCCINDLDRMRIKTKKKASPNSDEDMLMDNPVYISGPMVISPQDETDRKEVPTDEVYAAVMKSSMTNNQSVTHDPQPHIEDRKEVPTDEVYAAVIKSSMTKNQSVTHDPQPHIEDQDEIYGEPVIETEVDEDPRDEEPVIETEVDSFSGDGGISVEPVIETEINDSFNEGEALHGEESDFILPEPGDGESEIIEASVIGASEISGPVPMGRVAESSPYGSQESLTFDLEEAAKMYTPNTQVDSDFRSTMLEPVEENSEGSSQLNSTFAESDDTMERHFAPNSALHFSRNGRVRGNPRGVSGGNTYVGSSLGNSGRKPFSVHGGAESESIQGSSQSGGAFGGIGVHNYGGFDGEGSKQSTGDVTLVRGGRRSGGFGNSFGNSYDSEGVGGQDIDAEESGQGLGGTDHQKSEGEGFGHVGSLSSSSGAGGFGPESGHSGQSWHGGIRAGGEGRDSLSSVSDFCPEVDASSSNAPQNPDSNTVLMSRFGRSLQNTSSAAEGNQSSSLGNHDLGEELGVSNFDSQPLSASVDSTSQSGYGRPLDVSQGSHAGLYREGKLNSASSQSHSHYQRAYQQSQSRDFRRQPYKRASRNLNFSNNKTLFSGDTQQRQVPDFPTVNPSSYSDRSLKNSHRFSGMENLDAVQELDEHGSYSPDHDTFDRSLTDQSGGYAMSRSVRFDNTTADTSYSTDRHETGRGRLSSVASPDMLGSSQGRQSYVYMDENDV